MIASLFFENMKDGAEYLLNNKKYIIQIKKVQNKLFSKCLFEVVIMTELNKTDFNNFEIYADQIIKFFEDKRINSRKIAVSAIWYILSNEVDANDFKTINSYKNYRNMDNVISLVNCKTWEIFFKPEDISNRVFTKRMMFLCEQQNSDEKEIKSLHTEFYHLFSILSLILDNSRKTLFIKTITSTSI